MATLNLEATEAAAWSLKRLDWQFFCSMTYGYRPNPVEEPDHWVGCNPPPSLIRQRIIFQFLRVVCRSYGAGSDPLWGLQAVVRNEFGEAGGRAHHHCLLTIPGLDRPSKSDCFRIKNLWTFYCGKKTGFADVRLFDSRLCGEDYITKIEGLDGANSYELGKFSMAGDRSLILTQRCVWELHKKRTHVSRNEGRHTARLLRVLKRDRSQNSGNRKSTGWSPDRLEHPAWIADSRSGS